MNPKTLVEHLCKVRIERGLSQQVVARMLGLNKDCLSLWETGKNKPMIHLYPRVLAFLGYYPFTHDLATIPGKLQHILNCNGWSHKEAARALKVDIDTLKRWLAERKGHMNKDEEITMLWSQIPEYLKGQYRSP